MERKERTGLFWRLLEFWRQREPQGEKETGIGFWQNTERNKPLFWKETDDIFVKYPPEMQKKRQKVFWKETSITEEEQETESSYFSRKSDTEAQQTGQKRSFSEAPKQEQAEQKRKNGIFDTTAFRREAQRPNERQMGIFRIFSENEAWDMEHERHRPVPVEDNTENSKAAPNAEPSTQWKAASKESVQEVQKPEPAIDVEALMRQMTKRLWEERESGGRRWNK